VDELAKQINEHYKGKEVVIVGILKGSFLFMADLSRKINVENSVDFMSLSSYGESTQSSGNVRVIMGICVYKE
jgi:hypoxanthine phosphoribosyltransferase